MEAAGTALTGAAREAMASPAGRRIFQGGREGGGRAPRGPRTGQSPIIAAAFSRARALFSVSSYSVAGTESATIPAPA